MALCSAKVTFKGVSRRIAYQGEMHLIVQVYSLPCSACAGELGPSGRTCLDAEPGPVAPFGPFGCSPLVPVSSPQQSPWGIGCP